MIALTARHELLAELLQTVTKALHFRVKDVLEKNGLPFGSIMMMKQVQAEPGITLSEVARRTGLAKSHVSKTVDQLIEQGYLQKRLDPADQRLTRLHPTEKAERHFEQLHAEIRHRISAVVSGLPPEKVDTLVEGLQSLKSLLEPSEPN